MGGEAETWAELYDAVRHSSVVRERQPGGGITPVFPKLGRKPFVRLGRGLDQIVCTANLDGDDNDALEWRSARMGVGYEIAGVVRNSLWHRAFGETILRHRDRSELRLDVRLHPKGALVPLDDVRERFATFANGLAEIGVRSSGPWVVNRYDVALDLLFSDRELGLRFIEACSMLRYTKGRSWSWREEPTYGYVKSRSRKRFKPVGVVYDKGIETGSVEAGRWVRVEARRFYESAGERPRLSLLTPGAMQATFRDVFLDACPEGTKLDGRRYAMTLAELVRDDKLTRRQYEALAGFLVAEKGGTIPLVYSSETARRLAQEARRVGIPYQGREAPDDFSLDVWAMLREFVVDDEAQALDLPGA